MTGKDQKNIPDSGQGSGQNSGQKRVPGRGRLLLIAAGIVVLGGGLWLVLWPETPVTLLGPKPDVVPETARKAAPGEAGEVAGPRAPAFDVVRVSREGTGVIAGTAAPGATVHILADGKLLSEVQADHRGDWALIFDTPLPAGGTRLDLQTQGADGKMLVSRDEVLLSVPLKAVDKTAQEADGDAEGGDIFRTEPVAPETFVTPVDEGVVAVRLSHKMPGSRLSAATASEVLQRPSASADYLSDVMLDAVDYDVSGVTVLSGHGKLRRTVRIHLDNVFLAEVRVGKEGRWVYALSAPLDAQNHRLRLDQMNDRGEIEARVEIGLRLEREPAADRLKGDYAIVEGRDDAARYWRIAYRRADGSLVYTLVLSPDRRQIRDVNAVYPAGPEKNGPEASGSKRP